MSTDESLDKRPLPTAVERVNGKVTILAETYDKVYKLACRSHELEVIADAALKAGVAAHDAMSGRARKAAYRRIMELREQLEGTE
jgi:hypothetical protein